MTSSMNTGVELLLKRMETHPEEFAGFNSASKWGRIIADYQEHLDEADVEALKQGLKNVNQQKFTELVLEGLVDPKPSEGVSLNSMAHPSGMLGAGLRTSSTLNTTSTGKVIIPSGSITLGNSTLDESTLEHMKAHIEAIRKQKTKAHNTIYGKLKNYLGAD